MSLTPPPPTQAAQPFGPTLAAGGWLPAGNALRSWNGLFAAEMQGDGNFVVYQIGTPASPGRRAIWASNTVGKGGVGITMQTDSNLVIQRSPGWGPVWATGTNGRGGNRVSMQDDGNLVIYTAGNAAVWASNTARDPAALLLPWQQATPPAPAPVPVALTGPATLARGAELGINAPLLSPSKRFVAVLQPDGNFVVYDGPYTSSGPGVGAAAKWSTGTHGSNAVKLAFQQSDGNLVLYRADGGVAGFSAGTTGRGGATLTMQDDGNLVMRKADGTPGTPVWDSWGNFDKSWITSALEVAAVVVPVAAIPVVLATGDTSGAINAIATDAKAAGQVLSGNIGGAVATVSAGISGAASSSSAPSSSSSGPTPTSSAPATPAASAPAPAPKAAAPRGRWETFGEWIHRVRGAKK